MWPLARLTGLEGEGGGGRVGSGSLGPWMTEGSTSPAGTPFGLHLGRKHTPMGPHPRH